jgi:hypothetical protein
VRIIAGGKIRAKADIERILLYLFCFFVITTNLTRLAKRSSKEKFLYILLCRDGCSASWASQLLRASRTKALAMKDMATVYRPQIVLQLIMTY